MIIKFLLAGRLGRWDAWKLGGWDVGCNGVKPFGGWQNGSMPSRAHFEPDIDLFVVAP
jgi:hypothetical protein